LQIWLTAAKPSKSPRALPLDERAKAFADESRLLAYSGKTPRFFEQLIIDIQCGAHGRVLGLGLMRRHRNIHQMMLKIVP